MRSGTGLVLVPLLFE